MSAYALRQALGFCPAAIAIVCAAPAAAWADGAITGARSRFRDSSVLRETTKPIRRSSAISWAPELACGSRGTDWYRKSP